MDGNLAMQNNISNEEPAEYLQRVYGLSRLDASKCEDSYIRFRGCGGKLNLDGYILLLGRKKRK